MSFRVSLCRTRLRATMLNAGVALAAMPALIASQPAAAYSADGIAGERHGLADLPRANPAKAASRATQPDESSRSFPPPATEAEESRIEADGVWEDRALRAGTLRPPLMPAVEQRPAHSLDTATEPTHLLYIRMAVDEEYRAKVGSGWDAAARNAVEAMDNAFFSYYGIDARVTEVVPWRSNTNSTDPCKLLPELKSDIYFKGADLVGALTGQGSGPAGCAYRPGRNFVVRHSTASTDWKAIQHEVSHNYGAFDRYIAVAGDNPNHPDDVMEDPYHHYNIWESRCPTTAWDYAIIRPHRAWYDGPGPSPLPSGAELGLRTPSGPGPC